MQANRSRDTLFELAVRRILHAKGLRYRVDSRPVPSLRYKADLVFRGARVAVFLDGCFWHGCDLHFTAPKANAHYWKKKIALNRERDRKAAEALREAGWSVLRYWEHQPADEIAEAIASVVRSRN